MSASFDRRRIAAPEESCPPSLSLTSAEGGPSTSRKRIPNTARPIYLKTGLVTQANGSAYIEVAGIKIACSVFGPRPKQPPYSAQGTLNVEVKFAPFASSQRRAPLKDTEPINLSTLLSQLLLPTLQLHLLPKSSIDIHLLVLEADSETAILSAGLTASSAAIADAGIPMSALAVGAVAGLAASDELLLDPTGAESVDTDCTVTLGAMPALGRVTNIHLVGECDEQRALQMLELAFTGATSEHTTLAQAVIEGSQRAATGAERL